jgi:membrane-associated phospholipid phosphatase
MLAFLLLRGLPQAWHLPVVMAAVTLILLVGFSRLFLQVHFFSDVIAGYASGTAWLAVCIASTEIALAAQRRGSL